MGLLVMGLTGCPKKGPTHPAELHENARPLMLWQVTKGDDAPDYLFGTCHVAVDLAEALPKEMYGLVEEADRFVMEADMSQMVKKEALQRLALQGETLDDLLGAETYQQLATTYELGIQAEPLNKMHPFVLSSVLTQKLTAEDASLRSAAQPMDLVLMGLARRNGVATGYLETVDEQLDLFLNRPTEDWVESVKAFLDDAEKEKLVTNLKRVLDTCRRGDTAGAAKAIEEESDEWMEQLLSERNRDWIPKLEAFFEGGQTFVAVGAAHLFAQDNVLQLLKKRGYTIRRMSGLTLTADELAKSRTNSPQTMTREQILTALQTSFPALVCGEASDFIRCFGGNQQECAESFDQRLADCVEAVGVPDQFPAKEAQSWGQKIGACAGQQVMNACQ